eukprot:scaffold25190_cov137-Cylindrotheca_fusiformis.AAC.4
MFRNPFDKDGRRTPSTAEEEDHGIRQNKKKENQRRPKTTTTVATSSLRLFTCCHSGEPLCSFGDMWGCDNKAGRRRRSRSRSEMANDDYSYEEDCSSLKSNDEDDDDDSLKMDYFSPERFSTMRQRRRQLFGGQFPQNHSLTEKFITQSHRRPPSTSISSTARTSVIQNTALRNTATTASQRANNVNGWIQDPPRCSRSTSVSTFNSILAMVPTQEEDDDDEHQQQEQLDEYQKPKQSIAPPPADPQSPPNNTKNDDEPSEQQDVNATFNYWKRMDQKLKAQKQELEQRQLLQKQKELKSLQEKKQEQTLLAQSRLGSMFPQSSTTPTAAATATVATATATPLELNESDVIDSEVPEEEQDDEDSRLWKQKEAQLAILQSAIDKRLEEHNGQHSDQPIPNEEEISPTMEPEVVPKSRLERKLEGDQTSSKNTDDDGNNKWLHRINALPPLEERTVEEEEESMQSPLRKMKEEENKPANALTATPDVAGECDATQHAQEATVPAQTAAASNEDDLFSSNAAHLPVDRNDRIDDVAEECEQDEHAHVPTASAVEKAPSADGHSNKDVHLSEDSNDEVDDVAKECERANEPTASAVEEASSKDVLFSSNKDAHLSAENDEVDAIAEECEQAEHAQEPSAAEKVEALSKDSLLSRKDAHLSVNRNLEIDDVAEECEQNEHAQEAIASAGEVEASSADDLLSSKDAHLSASRNLDIDDVAEECGQDEHAQEATPAAQVEASSKDVLLSGKDAHLSADRNDEVDDCWVLPLLQEDSGAPPPTTESAELHRQHLLESPDLDNAQSLRPNQRLQPIHCRIELPKVSPRDEEKERRMAAEKKFREEFKAARLKALMAELQQHEKVLDDLSTGTISSSKTAATSQTTQLWTSSSSSSTSCDSSCNVSRESPMLLPTITHVPNAHRTTTGVKRGESAKLAAKRKELESKWKTAKTKTAVADAMIVQQQPPKSPAIQAALPSSNQQQDGKWLMDYKPVVGRKSQSLCITPPPNNKVGSKKNVSIVTPSPPVVAVSSTVINDTTIGETKLSVSEMVARKNLADRKKEIIQERSQKKKNMQAKWEQRLHSEEQTTKATPPIPPRRAMVVTARSTSKPSSSVGGGQQQQQQQQHSEQSSTVTTGSLAPDHETVSQIKLRFSGFLEQHSDKAATAVTQSHQQRKANQPPRVMGFWEQKVSDVDSKTNSKAVAAMEVEGKPLSKLDAKRLELAEQRKSYEKHKAEASKRLEQELLAYCPSLDEELKAKKAAVVDTQQLVGKFESLATMTTTNKNQKKENDGFRVRTVSNYRLMADWKQKELDRRNNEYIQGYGGTDPYDAASSVAWPAMQVLPPIPATSKFAMGEEEEKKEKMDDDTAGSDHSVAEKDLSRKQKLRQAWRHRAWKTIDKVDHGGSS